MGKKCWFKDQHKKDAGVRDGSSGARRGGHWGALSLPQLSMAAERSLAFVFTGLMTRP